MGYGQWGVHPTDAVAEAGGTQPTGMHTCFIFMFFSNKPEFPMNRHML